MEAQTNRITASHMAYLVVCHRKLWLYASGIEMEHFSEQVLEGRLIHNTAYPRRPSKYVEVQLDGVKIDFYDPQSHIVHETKRGRAIEAAHRAQVQYYLYKLWLSGIPDATGIIEYPDLRKTESIPALLPTEIQQIKDSEQKIRHILALTECPEIVIKPYCRNCAYHDFCFINEP
jgi:CRISPR-associated exonuclease Cas4